MSHPLLLPPTPERPATWHCAMRHCTSSARTVNGKVPHHPCQELGGALVPLVRDDDPRRHHLVPREREDHVGSDLVRPVHHRGKLIMAVDLRTDDSLSTTVYAPTAVVDRAEALTAIEEARDG